MNNYRFRRLRILFKQATNRNPIYAVVGDGNNPATVYDPSKPGYVYVQIQYANGYGAGISVLGPMNTTVKLTAGTPVVLEYTADNKLKIAGYDVSAATNAGTDMLAPNVESLPSSGFIGQQSIATALVTPQSVPDLTVVIKSWAVVDAGIYYEYPGTPDGGLDLSSFVPASGENLYAVVFINSTFDDTVVGVSTARSTSDLPLNSADIQEAIDDGLGSDSGATPLAAVRLYGDQEEILNADIAQDIRQLINTGSGSGSAAFYQTIQDNGTPLTQEPIFDFIPGTNTTWTISDDGPGTRTKLRVDAPSSGGTVTSVAVTVPSILSVAGSPITTSGTIAITLATQTANTVFAGPTTGAAATPTFRALVAADIPSGGGSPLTTKGDLYTFSTVNTRLAVGANNTVLVADSAAATGNKWSATLTGLTLDNGNTVTLKDTLFTLQDDGDTTKQLKFQLSGITTGTTRTLTVPNADDTIAVLALAQSFTNKTLDNTNTVTLKDTLFTLQDDGDVTKQARFQLSSITAGQTRTYTLPDLSDTIVTLTATQTLTNKTLDNTNTVTLKDTLFTLQDNSDTTKQAQFELSGLTASTTRTYTLRDESGTIQMQRLTTKGDLLTYSTTDVRLGVGTDGQVFVADSAATTGNKWRDGLYPQNALLNSGFILNSRSAIAPTTAVTYSDTAYSLDQWYVLTQTSTITVEQGTDNTHIPTSPNFIRLKQTQASAQRMGVAQIVENLVTAAYRGRTPRLQFYARCSSAINIRYAICEYRGTADNEPKEIVADWTSSTYTAGNFFISSNFAVNAVGVTALSANTWSAVIALNGIAVDNAASHFYVFFWTEGTVAQNATLDIKAAGLYDGNDPIPYFSRTTAEESLDCQRFLKVFHSANGTTTRLLVGTSNSTTHSRFIYVPPVEFRTTPTLTATASDWDKEASGGVTALTAIAIDASSTGANILIDATVAGTVNQAVTLNGDGGGDRYMIMSAEMGT